MKIPKIVLPPFSMSDKEIDESLQKPIDREYRIELRMPPDLDKPSAIRRVVADGMFLWRTSGDRPLAKLVLHLLYLYFTGRIQIVSNEYVSRVSYDAPEDDEDFDDDFGFAEG